LSPVYHQYGEYCKNVKYKKSTNVYFEVADGGAHAGGRRVSDDHSHTGLANGDIESFGLISKTAVSRGGWRWCFKWASSIDGRHGWLCTFIVGRRSPPMLLLRPVDRYVSAPHR
jgi:hypothetical protein